MSWFYFFSQKIIVKLIQSDVLLHKASLNNEVIQIPYGAIPKVSTFQKKLLLVFFASLQVCSWWWKKDFLC